MEGFLNLTNLSDSDAKAKIENFREIVLRAEEDREERVERDEKNREFWRNNIWTQDDIDNFFKPLDIRPYEFAVQRPLINNLIYRQRSRRITFDVVPTDSKSYGRFLQGRDEFVEENLSNFNSISEAQDFYEKYADDEYAKALSSVLHNTRVINKAKYTESEVFERGLVSGLDFFKGVYSNKHQRNGGIEISRRPQNSIFYDESSTEYDLSDIEFIGEVHLMYKNGLITAYPDAKDKIEEHFKTFTNLDRHNTTTTVKRDWEYFYSFNRPTGDENKARVAEFWYLDTVEKFLVKDNVTGETRVVKEGITEEQLGEKLLTYLLLEYQEQAKTDPEVRNKLRQEGFRESLASEAEERYDIGRTYEPCWYKAVFTFNALLEYKKSPYPHQSHPYYPYYCQYTEGEFHSLMDDIRDVIIAINKALAFRELMMAHGSKGLVVVDEKTMTKSGYDADEIAEHWTTIGGALVLKLPDGKRINDVIDSITTVGQGLEAINAILADLDSRLYRISGVNLAQLGVVERETTSSGFSKQVSEGEANNGLIYDNFIRSLEGFYNDKIVPLVSWMMKNKQSQVIRMIGEDYQPWLEIDIDEEFDTFERAIREGEYTTVLKAKSDNAQLDEERSAKLMELALAGAIPPEVAIEYSTNPDRYKIVQSIKKHRLEMLREQAKNQVEMGQIQEIASKEIGMSSEMVSELLEKLKVQKMKEQYEQQNPRSLAQNGQGAKTIKEQAKQTQTRESIDQNTTKG